MLITERSIFTGKYNTREINVTAEQLANWRNGMLIQDAMPHLSKDDREFIQTGSLPEEWDLLDKGIPDEEIFYPLLHDIDFFDDI